MPNRRYDSNKLLYLFYQFTKIYNFVLLRCKPVYFKTKVLDIQGILTDTISEEQKQSKQEDRLVTSGFASLMSKEFNPALDLEDFDALEYRVRVVNIF